MSNYEKICKRLGYASRPASEQAELAPIQTPAARTKAWLDTTSYCLYQRESCE